MIYAEDVDKTHKDDCKNTVNYNNQCTKAILPQCVEFLSEAYQQSKHIMLSILPARIKKLRSLNGSPPQHEKLIQAEVPMIYVTWWDITTTGARCRSSSIITGSSLQVEGIVTIDHFGKLCIQRLNASITRTTNNRPLNNIQIRLPTRIPIPQLVLLTWPAISLTNYYLSHISKQMQLIHNSKILLNKLLCGEIWKFIHFFIIPFRKGEEDENKKQELQHTRTPQACSSLSLHMSFHHKLQHLSHRVRAIVSTKYVKLIEPPMHSVE